MTNDVALIFTNDFLLHSSQNNAVKHTFLQHLLNVPIKTATGKSLTLLTERQNQQGEIFSREKFFLLSKISLSSKDSYVFFDKKKITRESISYLKQYCNENTIVIGVELSLCLREILTAINCLYLNFWFHPYHLFDDIFFGVATNKEIIFSRLQAYMIPEDYFYFYAVYWKEKINRMKNFEKIFIEENSAVFIGQTMKDQSIQRDGIFLNITHFSEICRKEFSHFAKIYYVPHPYEKEISQDIMDFLKQFSQITILENVPVYYLLASSKIKKVFGISSSVLYEARFFGKEIQYFYQPLFYIDGDFNLNTFISIYNNYFSPSFWNDILEPVIQCRASNIPAYNLLEKATNKLRDVTESYHGYLYLDKIKLIHQKLDEDKYQKKEFRRLCIFLLITLISCYPLLEISSMSMDEKLLVYSINIMRFLTPLILIFLYRQTLFTFKRRAFIFLLFLAYILLVIQTFLST